MLKKKDGSFDERFSGAREANKQRAKYQAIGTAVVIGAFIIWLLIS